MIDQLFWLLLLSLVLIGLPWLLRALPQGVKRANEGQETVAEPPITIRASYSSFTAGDNTNPNRVVIHATNPGMGFPRASRAGTALDTAGYFASGKAGGSAHYIEDIASETHCVPDNTIAYHAPPNEHSLGIEICADGGDRSVAPTSYTRDQWLSPQVWPAVLRSAERTRELCTRFGIPMVRLSVADLKAGKHGICGHVDVSLAFKDSNHSDPGPDFPWAEFMVAVLADAPAPAPTPAPVPAVVATKKEFDPMTLIPIQYQPTGAFRGTTTAESAASGSQVIKQLWVTFNVSFADPKAKTTFKFMSWAGNGAPLDQRPFLVANNCSDVYVPHAQARSITIEGQTQPGAIITVTTVALPS